MRLRSTALIVAALACRGCAAVCGHTTLAQSSMTGTIRRAGALVAWTTFQPVGASEDRLSIRWDDANDAGPELRLRFTSGQLLGVGTFTLEALNGELCRSSQCVSATGTLAVSRFAIDRCFPDAGSQAGCPVHLDADLRATAVEPNGAVVALDLHLVKDDRWGAYTHCVGDRFGH